MEEGGGWFPLTWMVARYLHRSSSRLRLLSPREQGLPCTRPEPGTPNLLPRAQLLPAPAEPGPAQSRGPWLPWSPSLQSCRGTLPAPVCQHSSAVGQKTHTREMARWIPEAATPPSLPAPHNEKAGAWNEFVQSWPAGRAGLADAKVSKASSLHFQLCPSKPHFLLPAPGLQQTDEASRVPAPQPGPELTTLNYTEFLCTWLIFLLGLIPLTTCKTRFLLRKMTSGF